MAVGMMGHATAPVRAYVSVPPHAYFVDRIGGEHVEVGLLVRASDDPHSFNPTPGQVAGVVRAQLFFRTGMPFEETLVRRLQRATRDIRVVDLREGIDVIEGIPCAGDHHHSKHGEDSHHHHHHDQEDPHIWLSPRLAAVQADHILAALVAVKPSQESVFRDNHQQLVEDLHALHGRLQELLEPVRGSDILVYHAAFGYFCREYGLRQVPVETGGREPSPRAIRDLIAQARESGTRVIFVQPQFHDRSAQVIAEAVGGTVVAVDPLSRDYLNNLEVIGRAFESSGTRSSDERISSHSH